MGNLSIIYRKIPELKRYPRNARTHSRKQIKQIAAAICLACLRVCVRALRGYGFSSEILR